MTMPAGSYWIGDLCYVFDDDSWDEICGLLDGEGEFTLKDGRRIAIYSTAWGDGIYEDQHGFVYGVDSGTLGCVLASDVKICTDGSIVQFDYEFNTEYDNGNVVIGHIRINTDPDVQEPDDDFWYEKTA
jgi:hypothetical protein